MEEPANYEPATSADELLQRYDRGESYFAESHLPDGSDFSGINLEGASLERSWLFDANFSGANLRGVSFCGSNLKCADFSNANLEGAKFEGAAAESLILEGAKLGGVNFAGAYAYGHELQDGQMP